MRFSPVSSTTADLPEQTLLAHDLLFMPHGFITGMPYRNVYEDE